MKLTKIYEELLDEDLEYAKTDTEGEEDDEYTLGCDTSVVPFNTDLPELKEGIDKAQFNRYLKASANDNLDMAKETLNNLLSSLSNLPNTLKLYRVVFLESPQSLNKDKLGSHYVLNQNELEGYHYNKAHENAHGDPYILTVNTNKNMVDFDATILHNMQYPNEKEITLKNKGAGAKLLNVEPFNSNDNFELDGLAYDSGYDDYTY